ncbi:nitroreductase family protein [Nesterenkonia pannonica]|uniref:nitroreductase family protein n=1 Tax=Nesterenkonia pannonica TaxID=1548602 RepID=UPI002164AF6B|nr:nitroreductase family protein [Nesterenkonia pannonica]
MTSASAMEKTLDRDAIDRLFEGSHTTNAFTAEPVDLSLIQQVYEDLRWAPTAFNAQPLRLSVLTDGPRRDAVIEHMMKGNQDKTKAAPLTLVAAYTADWHEHLPTLQPQRGRPRALRRRREDARGRRQAVRPHPGRLPDHRAAGARAGGGTHDRAQGLRLR